MRNTSVGRILIASAIACIGLTGPLSPAIAKVFSSTGTVIAIMNGELFIGEAEGHLDGAGTIAIRAQKNPALTCLGEFTSSAKFGGMGQLRCSDGATGTFYFKRLSVFRGHGAGTSSRGAMSFSYGMSAEEAAPYLTLPGGKKFSPPGTELMLVDAS